MVEYPNFYENLKEALKRLKSTVVLYEGAPYYIHIITAHKPDGIFRAYMEPLATAMTGEKPQYDDFDYFSDEIGNYLDAWLADHPETPIVRKYMSSKGFDKFRPFPLGMCNYRGDCYYLDRIPNRLTQQGLLSSMVIETKIGALPNKSKPNYSGNIVSLFTPEFEDCVYGRYPSAEECLQNLQDPLVINESAAFHRYLALVRGPLNTIYLAYRTDVVGYLPMNSLERLVLGRDFGYLKEFLEESETFGSVVQQQ